MYVLQVHEYRKMKWYRLAFFGCFFHFFWPIFRILTIKTPNLPEFAPQNTQKRLKLKFLPLKNTKKAAFGSPKSAKNPKRKLSPHKNLRKCQKRDLKKR
jgi:hypothetical protein